MMGASTPPSSPSPLAAALRQMTGADDILTAICRIAEMKRLAARGTSPEKETEND